MFSGQQIKISNEMCKNREKSKKKKIQLKNVQR